MATLSINTQHAHHGPRQPWSPVASSPLIIPSSTSPESSLSARCRALAHRLGHEAVQDDAFSHSDDPEPTTPSSPRRLSPSGQGSPRFSPLVSPRSGHRDLHPPPTPEGSFVLETLQEESETPRAETAQLDFGTASSDVAPSSSSLSLGGEGAYGASAPADDEMSSSTSWSGRFGFAAALAAGGSASQGDDIHEKQELAQATTDEEAQVLRQAMKEGTTWLAADIWLSDGELLVGRSQEELDPGRTFSSCFVEPLLRVFQTSAIPVGTAHRRRSSVFSHVSLQNPFQLILRLHTAPTITFPYIADALQPLHDASLLTTFCPNASHTTPALITVVSSSANGAEMVPLEDLTAVVGPRFVYRDADISALEDDEQWEQLDNEVTPVAAGQLKEATGWTGQATLSEGHRERIVKQVERAHAKRLKLRYEGLPQFPLHIRENVKTTLVSLGADYL